MCSCNLCTVCASWSSFVNQNSMGATNVPQYATLMDCLSYCVSNVSCVAVDFDSSDKPCWIHTDVNDLAIDNTYSIPGISQFILNRSCSVIGKPTCLPVTSVRSSVDDNVRLLFSDRQLIKIF